MGVSEIKVIILSNDQPYKTALVNGLKREPGLNVISALPNIIQAKTFLDKTSPAVIILDIDTQTATSSYLKILMETYNLKFILAGTRPGIQFTGIGIRDILHKQAADNAVAMNVYIRDIAKRIKGFFDRMPMLTVSARAAVADDMSKLIVMAASTGGTEALPVVLSQLPADMPPILIVQHMPSVFTRQFADRIDKMSKLSVREAVNGEYVKAGLALIAPGDLHMKMIKKASKFAVETFFSEKVHGVRPAADILFHSVLNIANPKNVIGVVLTGMGADGARGLCDLHNKGARVIAQDKESCVVFGMPKVAIDLGAADHVLPLDRIAEKIVSLI